MLLAAASPAAASTAGCRPDAAAASGSAGSRLTAERYLHRLA
jgi:hypothetical protein